MLCYHLIYRFVGENVVAEQRQQMLTVPAVHDAAGALHIVIAHLANICHSLGRKYHLWGECRILKHVPLWKSQSFFLDDFSLGDEPPHRTLHKIFRQIFSTCLNFNILLWCFRNQRNGASVIYIYRMIRQHIKQVCLCRVNQFFEAVLHHKIVGINEQQIFASRKVEPSVSRCAHSPIGLMHHLHLWVFFGIAVAYLACGVGRAIVHGNHFVI